MAGTMLHASLLPAITCSSCGQSVELSMLGDHICDGPAQVTREPGTENVPPLPSLNEHEKYFQPASQAPSQPPIPASTSSLSPPSNVRPPQTVRERPTSPHPSKPESRPPTDARGLATGPPPVPPPPPIPTSATTSPNKPTGRRPSLFQPPSGNLPISQDSPFPMFPMNRKASTASVKSPVMSPKRTKPPPQPLNLSAPMSDASFAPKSPRMIGGTNLLERMGAIAPGPFDTKHRKTNSKEQVPEKPMGIFRRKLSRKASNRDVSKQASSADAPPVPPTPTVPNTSFDAAPSAVNLDEEGKVLPTGPPPARPERPTNVEGLVEQLRTSLTSTKEDSVKERTPSPPASLHNAEQQLLTAQPEENSTSSSPDLSHNGDSFRMSQANSDYETQASEPPSRTWSGTSWSSYPRSPTSNSQHNHGLPQISEIEEIPIDSIKKPPPPAWSTGKSFAPPNKPVQTGDRAALPQLNTSGEAMKTNINKPRTMTESTTSSSARSLWEGVTDSSRSSPQTSSVSAGTSRSKQFEESADAAGTEPPLSPTSMMSRAANFSRPRAPTAASSDTNITSSLQSPTSRPPLAPIQAASAPASATLNRTTSSASSKFSRDPSTPLAAPKPSSLKQPPSMPLHSNHPPKSPRMPPHKIPSPPPVPNSSAPISQNHPRSKGLCRGCGLDIFGKSIKAADGSLSGRYHKECFVCKTCRKPFPSMDFYIFKDSPYCAHDYHTLNRTMCQGCNKGIEGHYVQNDHTKFHLDCFKCHGCKMPLTRDYFEIDGHPYCEKDADAAHQKNQFLAPGKRFPERRTTRLMMT